MENEISNFRLEYRITNFSNEEMVVKTRGGLNYIIRKSKQLVGGGAKRRVYIRIANIRFSDLWIDKPSARTLFDQEVLSKLEEESNRIEDDNSFTFNRFSHDVNIVVDLTARLADENDVIHSDILGVSFFGSPDQAGVSAINTPSHTLQRLFEDNADTEAPKGGLHYFIHLNDPLCTQLPYYTNVMGKAVQVPVVNDATIDAGLYVGLSYGNSPPQKLYYSFAQLDKETLDFLGLFKTRAECEMGGNTERAISAEKRLTDVQKNLGNVQREYEQVVDQLEGAHLRIATLGNELTQLKQDHRHDIQQLKNDHRMELYKLQLDNSTNKAKSEIDKSITKASADLTKQRSSANNWGEIAKAAGAIATVIITGYRLCTS